MLSKVADCQKNWFRLAERLGEMYLPLDFISGLYETRAIKEAIKMGRPVLITNAGVAVVE